MKNREVFEKDIDGFSLENQGVAKVDEALDEQQQKTLRFELETFVCKGHYEDGLKRILEAYVETLRRGAESPAAWVSGFFGSGKSHLVKMLRALWTNTPFPDGRTPRDIAQLTAPVADALKELDTLARQKKVRLSAASGTLSQGEGDSIRKAVLSIVFKAVGLPAHYDEARALMWLRSEGIELQVRATLKSKNRTLERELSSLTVSTNLHEAILVAKPGLARDSHELGDRLDHEFSSQGDVNQDEFTRYLKEAILQDGSMPIFLLVLDELQQYIADSAERAMGVQEVIETLTKGFDGRALVVATGQSSLASGMATLQKLLGRFPVPVQLSDSDVEEVLRETVLKKKASAAAALNNLFSASGCLGEVSAHLRRSTFEHRREDEALLTPSYPLLPTRQRLWERVLGTTDTTGTGIQLRSQLRLAFDAVRRTKDELLGHIVGGDFIYDEIRLRLRQANQISNEIANTIDSLDGSNKSEDKFKARVLKAVFLLTRVTSNSAQDTGLHADAQSIADVLVDDLTSDTSPLRAKVKAALDELVETDHKLMRIANVAGGGAVEEYRLQTKESADWFSYLRNEEVGLRSDPSSYETRIREQLNLAAGDVVRKLAIPQGLSKEIRRFSIHTDPVAAPKEQDGLFVWLRSDLDGTQAKEVAQDAARAGLGASLVFVHVGFPKKGDLVTAIVTREAASRTLGHFGQPKTNEGQEARNALVKQESDATVAVTKLLVDALSHAQVFQGGGQAVEDGDSLEERLKKAGSDSAARLFSKFALVDTVDWAKALDDAAKGLVNALERVNFMSAAETHPAAQEVLAYIGAAALKGAKLRERYMGVPYGWPRAAIDALLAVLFATGQLKITTATGVALSPGKFLERDVNNYTFARETTPLSTAEKRAIARLTKCKPDDAEIEAPKFVVKLKESFARATGDAPRPAPTLPSLLMELDKLSGRELVKRLAEEETAASQLLIGLEAQVRKIEQRLPAWNDLGHLVEYLVGMPEASAIDAERAAILNDRQLLADPDPVAPLVSKAADALRIALNSSYTQYRAQYDSTIQELFQLAEWQQLKPSDQTAILEACGLVAPEPAPSVATLSDVLFALGQCTPARWKERCDAVTGKVQQARALCAKRLVPDIQYPSLPKRIVRTDIELDEWLAEVRKDVLAKLSKGPVQF